MSKKAKPHKGNDQEWILEELERITEQANYCDDPRSALFRLMGALVAVMSNSNGTDPYRLASGLADNAQAIIEAGGAIPPLAEDMH